MHQSMDEEGAMTSTVFQNLDQMHNEIGTLIIDLASDMVRTVDHLVPAVRDSELLAIYEVLNDAKRHLLSEFHRETISDLQLMILRIRARWCLLEISGASREA